MTTAATATPLAKLADFLGRSLRGVTIASVMTDLAAANYLGTSVRDMVAGRASNLLEFITTVAPATGVAAGGTAVTLTGSGFTGATAVQFGGTAGTAFTVVSNTSITVTTPAKAIGTYAVAVIRPNGDIVKPSGFVFT